MTVPGVPIPMNAETSIQNDDGAWKITTPAQAWSYAAKCRIERKYSKGKASVGVSVKAEVEVLAGEIGLALVGSDPTRLEQELFIKPDGPRTVFLKGSDLTALAAPMLAMTAYAAVAAVLAVRVFRKTLA